MAKGYCNEAKVFNPISSTPPLSAIWTMDRPLPNSNTQCNLDHTFSFLSTLQQVKHHQYLTSYPPLDQIQSIQEPSNTLSTINMAISVQEFHKHTQFVLLCLARVHLCAHIFRLRLPFLVKYP